MPQKEGLIKLGITGHRPDKLGGYGRGVWDRLYSLAFDEIKRLKPNLVISGMALGWDQACARAALDLSIPLVAAAPCRDQERMWPVQAQTDYWNIMHSPGVEIVWVTDGPYAHHVMGKRNQWMVDHCTSMLALWDGTNGGTSNCVFKAQLAKKRVENVWRKWSSPTHQREMRLDHTPR